jgi:hypothetical protein
VALPKPIPGLVIHYSYLWHDQHRQGYEQGAKDRPCVLVSANAKPDADTIVFVAPVTHSAPRVASEAVEIPAATKRRLGLDDMPSWIVVTELNRLHWPGPDLRPIPGTVPIRFDYGVVPPGLLRQVNAGIAGWAARLRLRTTPRS